MCGGGDDKGESLRLNNSREVLPPEQFAYTGSTWVFQKLGNFLKGAFGIKG